MSIHVGDFVKLISELFRSTEYMVWRFSSDRKKVELVTFNGSTRVSQGWHLLSEVKK